MTTPIAGWALVYTTNSHSPRAKRWYHVGRVVQDEGKWYEVYWHPNVRLRGGNRAKVKDRALDVGVDLLPGLFTDAPSPRQGSELIRT